MSSPSKIFFSFLFLVSSPSWALDRKMDFKAEKYKTNFDTHLTEAEGNVEVRLGSQVIKADVPLSELFGYITDLRTMSSGRATANLTFAHYEFVPQNIADDVVKKVKGQ